MTTPCGYRRCKHPPADIDPTALLVHGGGLGTLLLHRHRYEYCLHLPHSLFNLVAVVEDEDAEEQVLPKSGNVVRVVNRCQSFIGITVNYSL